MKRLFPLCILLLPVLLPGCRDREMPARFQTEVLVERKPARVRTEPDSSLLEKKVRDTVPDGKVLPYHIIVSSFGRSEKAGAEALLLRLRQEGHPASLISSSGRYRVSIGAFATESQAQESLEAYRKVTGRPDIWILTVR